MKTKRISKTELYNNVSEAVAELLATTKTTKAFESQLMELLEEHLAPKTGGGSSQNPPKEIDGVMHYYCRYHAQYEPETNMVISGGKSKGYCRAAIAKWNKADRQVKALETSAVEYMSNGDFDAAQETATEAKELRALCVIPDYYDYESDWSAFEAK